MKKMYERLILQRLLVKNIKKKKFVCVGDEVKQSVPFTNRKFMYQTFVPFDVYLYVNYTMVFLNIFVNFVRS